MAMNLDDYLNNCNTNCIFSSPIPDICTKEDCCLGIDEAGRGPVLGAMVYAIAFYPTSLKDVYSKKQFADSKTLTEEKRETIFRNIGTKDCDQLGWIASVLSPNFISNSMFKRSKYNLNLISHDAAINLINLVLERNVKATEVFVDTVGPAEKYAAKLKEIFPQLEITVCSKADSLFPVVSAASICAKVIRDRIVQNWKFEDTAISGGDYGSGYPSDPTTKEYLSRNLDPVFGFPSFVRFSWSTVTRILDEDAVNCIWEEEEDNEEANIQKTNKSILQFFNKNDSEEKTDLNRFFKQRFLSRITNLDEL